MGRPRDRPSKVPPLLLRGSSPRPRRPLHHPPMVQDHPRARQAPRRAPPTALAHPVDLELPHLRQPPGVEGRAAH
ncbi:hypothetical protein VFPBJ_10918 [Purpureocillium lilacinum]|uniref:Uncharacterized protein n=1 Tax=Purpureocillium lilacinum TaxID=33203 RepID=A0A179FWV1_PURLI|nr:hypothetical protein VFPBJ_10918 [Purpureocillium lilacinum]